MMKYTMYNTAYQNLGRFWTIFDVLGLHAAAASPWTFLADMMGRCPCSRNKNKHVFSFKTRLISFLYFFYYRSFHRPLNLTPTARSGCGLHSLVLGHFFKKNSFLLDRPGRCMPVCLVIHRIWSLELRSGARPKSPKTQRPQRRQYGLGCRLVV